MTACLRRLAALPNRLAVAICVALVQGYQLLIGPWLRPACRYEPSCSHYMIASLRKYGFLKGLWKGCGRLCRCHPWGGSGFDPP
jgi:hypothetical protein